MLVVDDHSAVREGIEALLAGEPGLEPVGSAGRADDALELARETRPDVAIVDFQLGDRDGLSLCRQLKELPDPARVVLYSAYADGPLALAGVIAGADGVVHKAALASELCDTVRAVAAGGTSIPPPPPRVQAVVAARLDPEDLPILAMLIDGTDPDEIAEVLGIRPRWLAARRWAMLERLRRMPTRRGPDTSDWPTGVLPA
ncbi:MAG TPA: response regulator transcription factor [Gaiellaceae bacterium]|nr:response regulator transcription factor [Gaiellaceae bacterium]